MSDAPLRERPDGSTDLAVWVVPGARRSELAGRHGSAVKVRVAAPPEDGKANAAVLALLASVVGVQLGQLEIVAGASNRAKRVRFGPAAGPAVRAWVAGLPPPGG